MVRGERGRQGEGDEGERQCGERPGVCNSNGQIVIAERFDRWIMTSNDTPRWESNPSPLPRVPNVTPLGMPLSLFIPFLSLARLLAMCCLYHTGDADVDMRLRHAYAAAFGIGLCAANHRRET